MSDARQRWATFLGKVKTRLGEILAEADTGFDELIATEVIDPGPVSSAQNEVRARLFALRDKIDPAWDKLAPELGGTRGLEEQGRALGDEILAAADALEERTQQKQLARLEELAREELAARSPQCTRCGSALPEPPVLHRVENVTCTHCSAVNTVRPGPATAMAHALRRRPRNADS